MIFFFPVAYSSIWQIDEKKKKKKVSVFNNVFLQVVNLITNYQKDLGIIYSDLTSSLDLEYLNVVQAHNL